MMDSARLAAISLFAPLAWGCATSTDILEAEKQRCVECALRENPNPELLADAKRKFEGWCDQGDARSCSVLGVMYEQARGVPRDLPRAARLYGKSCRHGNARACVSLGRMMEAGTAARPDPAGAATMYEMACLKGEARGCHESGRLAAAAGLHQRAATHFRDGCKGGFAASCESLAEMTANGQGVTQSERRAKQLFRRACRGGQARACDRM